MSVKSFLEENVFILARECVAAKREDGSIYPVHQGGIKILQYILDERYKGGRVRLEEKGK